MRDTRSLNSISSIWSMDFEGSIEGKRAISLGNDTKGIKTWKLADLWLPKHYYDLRDDWNVFHEITMNGEDATLLIIK
ncbi:MAG: hypothetical protein J5858_02615 [Lentisphaeria bacterium]|nr:hypothetical protein [Lentisphaeria bacterium]